MVHSSPQKSTRQQLVKVPQVPCLYRHALNHGYYGIKKVGGKRKEHALKTTDRKLAERRLKVWLDGLSKIDAALEHMTLRRLVEKFLRVNQGKSAKTQATDRSIIKKLEKTWPADYDMKVMDVRPSHLNEWLSLHEKRLKHTSYNRYTGFLKQLFQIAVDDRIIVESPASKLKTPWKRPQKPVRHVPTPDQFKALVNSRRGNKLSGYRRGWHRSSRASRAGNGRRWRRLGLCGAFRDSGHRGAWWPRWARSQTGQKIATTQVYTRVVPIDLQQVHAQTSPSERRKNTGAPSFTFEGKWHEATPKGPRKRRRKRR